jgi:transaldolase / glucose-6-phosphate isomerase
MSTLAERPRTRTKNPLLELKEHGQSIWLDYIRRNLITSGELKRLLEEDGLGGLTSNPTIFDKAIAGGSDYDEQLRQLLSSNANMSPMALFDAVEIADIQAAADVLRPVYDQTGAADGFVSIEVSPGLATDTTGSIAEARRLWKAVNRPNLMVKIPATPEGIPAILTCIAEGININITLMFSLAHYEAVANAYISGLERNSSPQRVASVASFFVSRVDTAVDKELERIGTPEALALRGTIAIANSKVVYQRFREIFSSERWKALAKRGARLQRVLWASTGTKNPAYSDVLYIESLVGPDTVNTMPPATLSAFRDHGTARETVTEGVDQAQAAIERLRKLGIDLNAITENLQEEGVKLFSESMDKLLNSLEQKRCMIVASQADPQTLSLGNWEKPVEERLNAWQHGGFARRMWAKDYTLWSANPAPELTDRMGWLTLPETMHEQAPALQGFADRIRDEGFRHAVLLGMGGSSLAPEVFQRTFGNGSARPELIVLDSTHPGAVRLVESRVDLSQTLFLVSSKSGTTTETNSFFYYFWQRLRQAGKQAGAHFVAITDPGTPLERLAGERGFRRIFSAPPEVGGRYSVLSVFGLVPAALIGVDIRRLLDAALTSAESSAFCVPEPSSAPLRLGAAVGELALAGRDKLTFLASPSLEAFPIWLEQLIAESTGKDGKGIVPVADEPLGNGQAYGADRVFAVLLLEADSSTQLPAKIKALEAAGHPVAYIQLPRKTDLGQEFFRWEVAVAAAGAVLGINPFNQPDVQLAKELAKKAMAAGSQDQSGSTDLLRVEHQDGSSRAVGELLSRLNAGDYIGLQAYLNPIPDTWSALQRIRTKLRDRTKVATTLGFGPRFLHSTGQLHKGGPDTGVFLQILDEPFEELPVPETNYSFAQLIRAQAAGDYQALKQRGRRVLRVQLGRDTASGLQQLEEALGG